ncbi:MAG: hypothetical protein J7647_14060 [Cyanobacteria bacterium SBLK]|nr:hypothetical protein [Cyanobacteria bacterium SBLK]
MVLARSQSLEKPYWAIAKSFLTWSFTLTVCLLVVGFPLVVLMTTIAVLAAVILQSVLPVSAVLVVVGSTIGINVFAVLFGATVLTFKGIHPEEVSWLSWLHGETNTAKEPTFASCPLTCGIEH